jgi:acetolactate synthase-1/2/3 large subunit
VLLGVEHLILVSSQTPITFFAYPDKPNWLTPDNCQIHSLVERDGDVDGALESLCEAVGATVLAPIVVQLARPDAPKGDLNPTTVGQSLAHFFPENAIVVDEGGTCGAGSAMATASAPAHDWLMLTGGSIGYGLPTATGAAIACPDRRVINLQADGSAMYTVQALWTQVRENLDITTIILANRKYAILQIEFARVGAHNPGPKAMSMLDLTRPDLDWVSLAKGMGMDAWQTDSAESFNQALEHSLATSGPSLIEALV